MLQRARLSQRQWRFKGGARILPVIQCAGLDPIETAVVYPCDGPTLEAAVRAAEARLISPILIGPEAKIRLVASSVGIDIAAYKIAGAEDSKRRRRNGCGACARTRGASTDERQPAYR